MKFELRKWSINDLDNLVKYANNAKIARYMTDSFPHPYVNENGEKFIEFATSHDPQRLFAIDVNGEACGGIGIHPQGDIMRKNAELGYWLAEPYWGNGIMTEAIKQIVPYGFNTFDIDRIFARPFGTNKASQNILEKAGFVFETSFSKTIFKNGEFEDELFYSIRRNK